MANILTISEIVAASIASLVFSLLLVLSALRVRSRQLVVFHLALYGVLGLLLSLSELMLSISFPPLIIGLTYPQVSQITLLAMTLTFGALTLNFLKKGRNGLTGYWVTALIIFSVWAVFTFNNLVSQSYSLATFGLPPELLATVGLGQLTLSTVLAGLGWIVAIVTALVALLLDYRKRQLTQYKNRLWYWLIATVLLAACGLIWFTGRIIFGWAGLSLLIVSSILVGYTVLSYQTANLQLLVGRALRYSGVTAILTSVYFAGLAAAITLSRNVPNPTNVLLWSMLVAIFMAIIFPLAWRLSHRLLTGLVFGRQREDVKQVIKHYSQSISSALDMKRLGDVVINLMIETLGIEQGVVFVNERSGSSDVALRPLSSIGVEGLISGHLATDSPVIDHFRSGKKSLSQYDIDVLPEFRQMSDEERRWFASLGMELYIPIVRQRELEGLLAFGPQPQGTAYYDEDLDLMIALADQTALAMDSVRLFEQLAVVNQEVGSLNEQLAGLDQNKSDFLSIASHELRTPLTHIHGYSRMLLDLTEEELRDPTYVKTLIEGVAKGSERMKGVVDLMFDVTEADVGEMRLFTGPVNLEEVVDQASRPYVPAMDERRIAFGKHLPDLPVVEADGTRLVQAIENLIGNAVKYTPDGGKITVEAREVTLDDVGPAVEIMVTDSGIGIDPENHGRIFEKFYRIDDTMHHSTGKTKFKGAGPGLGLTLVKGIAEAHGGKVWVESLGHDEVNCPGSKFFVVLPRQAVAESEQPEKEKLPEQANIETRHWRRSDMIKKAEQ